MFKKWTACLLALAIVAQTSPSAFAQSKTGSEMNAVKACLEQEFKDYVLNRTRDQNVDVVVTTSQERLKFSKLLISVLLDINQEKLDRLQKSGWNTKLFVVSTVIFAYLFHTKSKKISSHKSSLENFLKNNRFNGQTLNKLGGEDAIKAMIQSLEKPTRNLKLITRGAVALTVANLLFAIIVSKNYMETRHSLSSTSGTSEDLFTTETESDFYLILAKDEPLMQTLRKNILLGCNVTEKEKQEIKNTVQNLEKISPQQFKKELQTFVQ